MLRPIAYRERPWNAAPVPLRLAFAALLAAQIGWRAAAPAPVARAEALPAPPPVSALRMLALGEPVAFAQLLVLRLQTFDNPPGISIPFRQLDYGRVEGWLGAILDLDPVSRYPLFLAAQLYAQVPDEAKQRRMLDFVYRRFLEDPERRWPWLAHAAIMAKHRLRDLPLALFYADAIARHGESPAIPHWASQMAIFLREDMGETEQAKILLGGLLAGGTVTDPHEIRFLTERLAGLEGAEKSSKTTRN